ncbi:hypothetical protein G9A89_018908 [Geosiphon pyriformis]|nr:hypothetical protein G9A89_018908 [Geosiphon pyriformis]
MDAISLDDLTCVIKNLPDGKAADLFAWVSIIPKPYEWEDILTNIRPIDFVSMWSIQCTLWEQFSVLKDTTTQSLIFVIGLVVENALEKDYMCKAYNSVGWHYLYNSLVWIKMCEHFIRFFGSIHNDCVNWGEVFFLLLWRIFYDPLLCEIKRQKSLCEYSIDTKFVVRTGRIEHQGSLTLFLAAGAFVNDTIWVSSSQVVTQYILDTASEFFRVNNISVNNKKTVAIPINQRVSNILLSISGLPISIACRKKSHQYFGIYLSSKGLSKQSLAKMHPNIKFFVNLVLKKAISDKQFLYLVLAVLQPIVSYRTQFCFISRNVCMKWDMLIRRELRLKAGLLRDFSNEAFHYSSLYGLKSFKQLQTKCKVAFVLCFLNASSVLGRLFNHRSLDLQILGWLPIHPLCCLIRLHISLVNNFLADIIRIFLNYDMSLDNLSDIDIYFYNVSSSLKKFGIAFAEQLYIKKDLIFDWKTFYHWKKLDPRGPVSRWFILVCLWAMNVCSSSTVSRLGQYFSSANMKVVNVYTDGLLRDLGLCEMKCDAAAYFLDLDLGIGVKVGGLVFLTMVELQTIALALECVLSDSLVVVYSDNQTALDAYVAESALPGLAMNSSLALPVLVKKKFIKAGRVAVSKNIHHFAHEIFRSINYACWEIGSGFNVIDDSLCDNYPDSHMATGFTSKSMAGLCSYFLKTFHCHLLIAVRKHLYSKIYLSVSCLHCGKVESSDHSFVCIFDSNAHKSILKSYLAK